MSSITLYDMTIPCFVRALQALQHILTKGESFAADKGIPEADFTGARLAPDMLPLTFQVQTTTNIAKNSYARLTGKDPISWDDNETTFAELQARVARTLDLLQKATKEEFEGDVQAEIVMHLPKKDLTFTRLGYTQTFALPNLYFHLTATYALLRQKGVDVGKWDYLAPPTATQ